MLGELVGALDDGDRGSLGVFVLALGVLGLFAALLLTVLCVPCLMGSVDCVIFGLVAPNLPMLLVGAERGGGRLDGPSSGESSSSESSSSSSSTARSSSPQTTTCHPISAELCSSSLNSAMAAHCFSDMPLFVIAPTSALKLTWWTTSQTNAKGCEVTVSSKGSYCSMKRRLGRLVITSGYRERNPCSSAAVVLGARREVYVRLML